MQRWDSLVSKYMEEYSVRGVCRQMVCKVRSELGRLGLWLKDQSPKVKLEEVNIELVSRYITQRSSFQAKATVYGRISVMRGMGDYLVRQRIWPGNILRWMKGPKLDPRSRIPRRIDKSKIGSLFEAAAKVRSGFHRALWVTVMAVFYGTGIRRGELIRLNVKDFDGKEGLLLVDGRKTGQERMVPLPPLAVQCMETYLPIRYNHLSSVNMGDQEALFVNREGGRVKAGAISRAIKAIARRCGIKLSLHQFRHSCGSDLIEAGISLPEVQKVLGHKTLMTTMRYLHIADPARHEAVKIHPINEMLSVNAGGEE